MSKMTKYEVTMEAPASMSYEWELPQLMKLREQQPDVIDQAIHHSSISSQAERRRGSLSGDGNESKLPSPH